MILVPFGKAGQWSIKLKELLVATAIAKAKETDSQYASLLRDLLDSLDLRQFHAKFNS